MHNSYVNQEDTLLQMRYVNRFRAGNEWFAFEDMCDALGLRRTYARTLANINVMPLHEQGIDIPMRKVTGADVWSARDMAQPGFAEVRERVEAIHEANGLPRGTWPQSQRVSGATLRARIVAANS